MKPPFDPDQIAEAMISGAKRYVDTLMAPLVERLAAAEQRAADAEQTIAAMVAKAVSEIEIPAPLKGDAGVGFTDAVIDREGALVLTRTDGTTARLGVVIGKGIDPADLAAIVADAVGEAVGAIPPAEPGKSVDPSEVERMVSDHVTKAVAAIPPVDPLPAAEVDMKAVAALVQDAVSDAVKAIPPVEAPALPDIPALVSAAVAALPPAKDGEPGKSVTVDDVRPVLVELVKALPPAEPGKPGAPGKLPIVRAWTDTVHREGEVVTHGGATWQATRDTGKEPPHDDWICLAAAGRPGKAADEIEVKGTYEPESEYRRLNIVALNGSAFMARKDAPGPCPGADWQVIAMRGKPGPPGEAKKGDPGPRGLPGPAIVSMSIDGQGLLTAKNADGSTVECDLYPVLVKVAG